MSKDIKINYHNSLREFSQVMDPVMFKVRSGYVNTQKTGILTALLAKPLQDIPKLAKAFKDIKNLNASLIPLLAGLGGLGLSFSSFDALGSIGVGVSSFLIGYLSLLPYYFWQMTLIHSRHFHIGTYRAIRREEYDYFSRSFLYEDFSFRGLYDYTTELIAEQGNEGESINNLIEHFNLEKRYLNQQIKELKEDKAKLEENLSVANETSDSIIYDLLEEQRKWDKTIVHLVELIKKANTALFRMKNGLFEPSDLMLVSGYTIYELNGDFLEKKIDIGTSGSSPRRIPLNSSDYEEWASVVVIKNNSSAPYYNNPYPGHTIVSYRMEMGNNKIWVYNFHIDEKSNEMALELTLSAILDTRAVYRLVHALCLLLQEQGFPKEVVNDGKSSHRKS